MKRNPNIDAQSAWRRAIFFYDGIKKKKFKSKEGSNDSSAILQSKFVTTILKIIHLTKQKNVIYDPEPFNC